MSEIRPMRIRAAESIALVVTILTRLPPPVLIICCTSHELEGTTDGHDSRFRGEGTFGLPLRFLWLRGRCGRCPASLPDVRRVDLGSRRGAGTPPPPPPTPPPSR